MDLLQSVRKEGSRGGRGEFKWEDVKSSNHRENYLGHSLMAPVGRWQKNRDLSWYAKVNKNGEQLSEADVRKEELRRVKQVEDEAMAKALGVELPVANVNMTELGKRERKFADIEPTRRMDTLEEGPMHVNEGDRRRTSHKSRDSQQHVGHDDGRTRQRRRDSSHERPRDRSRSRTRERRRDRSRDRQHASPYEKRGYDGTKNRRRQSDRGPRSSRSRSPDRRYRH